MPKPDVGAAKAPDEDGLMPTSQPSGLNETDLLRAFAERRFVLHFQPQFESRGNRLVGAEALVRLKGSDGEMIPPSLFMDRIERSDLIHQLGLDLFEQGCVHARKWPSLTIAINVSPVQFRTDDLADKLTDIAARAGVDPRRIEIEITEGLFFDDIQLAERALNKLDSAGFSIALDDFGTGYSSLGYLLRFPIGKIKIDRSFIVALPSDVKSASIVHALVALTRALGLKVVAEGIETEAQRIFLRTAGCHILQGYLLGKPMEADAITALLETNHHPA